MKVILSFTILAFLFFSCSNENDINEENNLNKLRFEFEFDENQQRLDNIGNPEGIEPGNAAQTPQMHSMSAHYIELMEDKWVQYGAGEIVYKGAETTAGGNKAIDFNQASITGEGELFKEFSLQNIDPGTYQYIRVSVSYQNASILYNLMNVPAVGNLLNESGTLACFLGYNNYISTLNIDDKTLTVNDDKLQGFWGFKTNFGPPYDAYNNIYSGESAGVTTVVNPLATTSSIPAGSCVITGEFDPPLTITGEETEDITVILSFSINNSFEWIDNNSNGQWDIDSQNPANNELPVDMGLRGLIPRVE